MSDHITVIGNIATEPERRQTSTGVPVISFRLATTQRHRDERSGQWVDGATNWYTVSAFRRLAEHAHASLQKGQRVIVTGKLKLRAWETSAKRGLDVEIDADAIGHDLLWGTSVFQRDGSSLVGDRAGRDALPANAVRAPGSHEPGEREGELVGAGLVRDDGWDAGPLGGTAAPSETPF